MRKLSHRVVSLLLCAFFVMASAGAASARPAGTGDVFVVSALPGEPVAVSIDGGVPTDLAPESVSGAMPLSAGRHVLTFTGPSDEWTMKVQVRVAAGTSSDVVIHRPASPSGPPVVTTYDHSRQPVAGDRGRVVVAHTATVPPADVLVDQEVVFANIANGEFATADVPSGNHEVSLVPATGGAPAVLGPLDLQVRASTLTRVYAVGQPEDGSMNVITAVLPLERSGSRVPGSLDAGSAGLAADVRGDGESGSTSGPLLLAASALLVMTVRLVRTARDDASGRR